MTGDIREHIKKGNIKAALDALDKFIQAIADKEMEKDFLLLSAQYHQEDKSLNLNLSNAKEPGNKIIHGIVHLLSEAKEAAQKKIIVPPGQQPSTTEKLPTGYCIRTGKPIPFNLSAPLSYDAYQIWRQFWDVYYPEKYCHFTGEVSNGDTCFISPVLKKNWLKAREVHGF
jgi:hypothetical protein